MFVPDVDVGVRDIERIDLNRHSLANDKIVSLGFCAVSTFYSKPRNALANVTTVSRAAGLVLDIIHALGVLRATMITGALVDIVTARVVRLCCST